MLKSILIFIFILLSVTSFSQYEAECFNQKKNEILLAIENAPRDSMHFQDTLVIDNVKRYVDTMFVMRNMDVDSYISKIIGCRMPDFNFFNLNKEEFSINKTKSEFIILNFSFECGDICNYQLEQYSKLQKVLRDSVAIYNIYEEPDKKVKEYVQGIGIDNLQFVANADLLTYHYSVSVRRPFLYLLDRHKNIIYMKCGQSQTESRVYMYETLLQKIRATNCSD